MPAWVAPLIAGGLSAIGSFIQSRQQQSAAQKSMDFQERMSSTAWRRGTEDMRLAGINPMLAFNQGGASSPGGAVADTSDVIGPAVSSAQHARRLRAEIDLIREQTRVAAESARRTNLEASVVQPLATAQINNMAASSARSLAEGSLVQAQIPSAWNRARFDSSKFGKVAGFADRIRETLFPWLTLPTPIRR